MILAVALTLLLTWASLYTYAQDSYYTKIDHKVSVGFQSGESFQLFRLYTPGKKKKHSFNKEMSLCVRLALNNHVKLASGLSFSIFTNRSSQTNSLPDFTSFAPAVPLTMEYHFFKKSSKLRPYIGAGVQYNFNVNDNPAQYKADWKSDYTPLSNSSKHISVIFTQGFIYEINTKIQVTQSFHFIPTSGVKTLGLDLGIGFTLP